MPQTQISCPRCRQMIPAFTEQLFDVTADPESKKRLLGGVSNRARCPFCGYEGNLATPIVYHDADKELLLTYFPPELGLPATEQERLIGPLITQVVNRLPAEKRKGYLLRPQNFLTQQSMFERILAADGVTKDMLDEQQKRVQLIQRLLQTTTPDVRSEIIKQNADVIDETFFALMSRLFEAALASGQQPTAQALNDLQQQLMAETEFGKNLKNQMAEMEAAVKTLQDAGQGLTREKLIEIFLDAPNDTRIEALTSLTRQGLDYSFFQILTEQIDHASGEEKIRLEALRAKLLDFINQLDKQMEEQMKDAQAFIDELLAAPNITQATQESISQFNEVTVQALNNVIREAQQKNDLDKLGKLQQIVAVLQAASAPPELQVLEHFLEYDEKDFDKVISDHAEEITPQFMEFLGGLVMQMSQQPNEGASAEDEMMKAKVSALYNAALKYSMKKNIG